MYHDSRPYDQTVLRRRLQKTRCLYENSGFFWRPWLSTDGYLAETVEVLSATTTRMGAKAGLASTLAPKEAPKTGAALPSEASEYLLEANVSLRRRLNPADSRE
jgi:hypothetical protein